MNERLYTSPAFRKTGAIRLADAANVEQEMIGDCLSLSQIYDSIDKAMGVDRHKQRVLQHPAVERVMGEEK